MGITTRKKEIIDYIMNFQYREGFPPSLREICKALGLQSAGSLIKHMRSLEQEGYISRIPGKKRAWKVSGFGSSIRIPLVGQIAAGTPILAEENREEDLPVDPRFFGSHDAFALRVRGDSMIDAQIRDGDLAIIRPQNDAENGCVVAVLVEDVETEATLKVFQRKNEDLELHSANSSYAPLVFKGNDRHRVRVLGKLIGVIRSKP